MSLWAAMAGVVSALATEIGVRATHSDGLVQTTTEAPLAPAVGAGRTA